MNAPSGWYIDPNDETAMRFYDGHRWTDLTNPPSTPGAAPPGAPSTPATPTPTPARSGIRAVPAWAWAIAAVAAVTVVIGVLAVTVIIGSVPSPPSLAHRDAPTSSRSPDQNGLDSQLVPELTFPAGSVVADHRPGDSEVWTVPLASVDTVRALRRSLPLGAEYDHLPWGSERLEGGVTYWSWGDDQHSLSVTVKGRNASTTDVYVDRTW